VFIGSSATVLPLYRLAEVFTRQGQVPSRRSSSSNPNPIAPPLASPRPSATLPTGSAVDLSASIQAASPPRSEMYKSFELTFMPLKKGFATVGGLRVVLLSDRDVPEGNLAKEADGEEWNGTTMDGGSVTLKEWDIIAEVMVR